tara:strand:- start:24933 stop:29486 length:4554 start_codon:yes stop_codon:yes gene_type:complete
MKIKFNELPDGFEVRNGEIIQVKQSGGSTGDQKEYSLVTTQTDGSIDDDIKVNYSMTSVPRDEANIEAEGGETVLTDLNGDGSFNLYDIKGPRHGSGGVPLFLPEQSFVFSDFSKMKFTKDEMAEMGIESKKKMTPAKISKKYGTNKFNALLKDPFVDNIQAKTADLMLEKNKRKLSKLSFMQEAKKDFEEGVPVTSFPFLVEQGQDPIEYTQQVEQITRQQAEQKVIQSLPPEQQMQIAAMQQYMAQVDQQQQQEQQGAQDQGMLPQQQGMQQEMQQGMQQMPQDMSQQGMMPPPPEMDNQQLAQMGFEIEGMSYAQAGTETSLKSEAEQFQQKDNENFLKERIIYRLNEHLNKERKHHGSDAFYEKKYPDKIKKLINILRTNDISSEDLEMLNKEIIDDSPLDSWTSTFSRTINSVSNSINQKYKDNTVDIDKEPDVDDEWDPAVDKLDRVVGRNSGREYFPSNDLDVINQRNVSNKEPLPNIQNADILPINLDLSNVQGTTNVSEVDEDLYTNREYFPTNNLETLGAGQIDNPVNPFNALQDFIPQEEVDTPEKAARRLLDSDDIYGEIQNLYKNDNEGLWVALTHINRNPKFAENYNINNKIIFDAYDAAEYADLLRNDPEEAKQAIGDGREAFNKNIESLKAQNDTSTSEKATRRLLDSDDIYGEIQNLYKNNLDELYSILQHMDSNKESYNSNINYETIGSAYDYIDLAFAYGDNLDEVERVNKRGREVFNKNIESLKTQNNTPTTDQSPQTSGDYRDKIIDYELSHGAADGTGLPLEVAFKKSVTGINFTGNEEEDKQKVREWIQTIDDKYSEYPLELRKRMVDFEINSEDPRAAMMEAAGVITSKQKGSKEFYPKGSLDKTVVDDYWAEYGPQVMDMIENDTTGFIDKFDAAKHRSYKFGTGAATSYPATHGPRVDMFNKDFEYGKWNAGQYYKYDKDKGAYIKSNQATTKEAEEFLDDPESNSQNISTAQEFFETEDGITVNVDPQLSSDLAEDKIFLGNEQLRSNYEALERTFKDPNSPAGKGLISRFREALNNNDYFGQNVSKLEKEKLRNLNEQEILDYFLMMQKRNLGAYAYEKAGGQKISDYAQTGDPKGEYKQLYDKMGMSYDDATGFAAEAQQAAYIAYRDLLKDRDEGILDDDQNDALTGYGIRQVGKEDEKYGIDAENNISRIEGHYGNTTLGQHSTYTPQNVIEDAEEAEDFPAAEKVTVEGEDEDINIQPNQLKVPYNPNDPRFWLQDLLKLNAIASRKRKKFYPWQPAVEDIDVDYVLEDPTRAIAATNEQMNLMAQGLGTFGGPQSFNSRMANVQAKTAASIANVTAGVHNRNINTINRGQAQQAQYDYMVDKENRTRNTKLYDDTMKVEQNALIEQNFDREQYADAMANAYSNMANTYNMNTLYDNYNIDPTTGGMMYFTNPNALDPSPNYETSKFEQYKRMNNQIRSRYNRDMNETEMKYFLGDSDQRQLNNYQREALNNNPAGVFGYDAKRTGKRGREINKLLPFFSGKIGI